jgi:hypothetical protein
MFNENTGNLIDEMLRDDWVIGISDYEENLTDEFEKWLGMYTQALENEKAGIPGASLKLRYLEDLAEY